MGSILVTPAVCTNKAPKQMSDWSTRDVRITVPFPPDGDADHSTCSADMQSVGNKAVELLRIEQFPTWQYINHGLVEPFKN